MTALTPSGGDNHVGRMPKRAVLLVNLGSPDSTEVADVKRYLSEFLGDERVIDKPESAFLRSVLVNQLIIPKRAKNSSIARRSFSPTETAGNARSRATWRSMRPTGEEVT